MARVKWGPVSALVIVPALVGGLIYANKHGMLDAAGAVSASVPQVAAVPDLAPGVEAQATPGVPQLPLPGQAVVAVPGPLVRSLHMAWNSQMGLMLANGGPRTTQGSLMEKHGVNLQLIREDDVMKMQAQLISFASALKKGDPNPSEGAHFMSVMGDGSAATIAGMEEALKKLGPDYMAEVIGSAGYSRGEDKLMGPPEWRTNPRAARGSLVSVYLKDGDWNIVMKWASDNQIKVNPNEKTYDPTAINFYAADDFMKAAEAYIAGACDERPMVIDGKKNGETKKVCVNAVSTWTPADVNVAKKKGGLVNIVSTKEYRSQMPNTIIGIRKWNQDNRKVVEEFLAAMYEAGDQVKAFPAAQQRAAEASWAVYNKEETPDYWLKYYRGVTEPDAKGLMVELGGSSVNNLQDAQRLYGLLPGTANLFAATYTVFGDIVKAAYPKDVPSYPPVTEVLNTSYTEAIARRSSSTVKADAPTFQAATEVKQVVSSRSWSINFETGKATFTPDALKQMRQLRDELLVADALSIEVVGHTDNTGDPARNLSLSQARAQAVRDWLFQQSAESFPANRFAKVKGMGDASPLPGADNATEAGRSKNRRVEIVLGKT
jgi:OOP family OmpA-OmpF porin